MAWILFGAALAGLVIGFKFKVASVLAASCVAVLLYALRVMGGDVPASNAALELVALLIVLQLSYFAGGGVRVVVVGPPSCGILHTQNGGYRPQQDQEVEAE